MKKIFVKFITLLVWVGIVIYFVFAATLNKTKSSEQVISRVEIIIRDSSAFEIVTPSIVRKWLKDGKFILEGEKVTDINTIKLSEYLGGKHYVKRAIVYVDINGVLTFEIDQRKPLFRVQVSNGYDFYVTDDNYILLAQSHETVYVPIVTGNFRVPFSSYFSGQYECQRDSLEKNILGNDVFIDKLIIFVRDVVEHDFWNSNIVHINVLAKGSLDGIVVLDEPEVEFVPRVGNHLIRLGRLVDVEEKLDKLMMFYENTATNDMWNSRLYINLSYNDQVVCREL